MSSEYTPDFGITLDELKTLMKLKNADAKKKIDEEYGGFRNFALNLYCDTKTGLSGDPTDLKRRLKTFGKNEIPPKSSKSIFMLAFEALQDITLIMLMICSIVSIGLSFYNPPSELVEEEFSRIPAADESNLEWIEGVAVRVF